MKLINVPQLLISKKVQGTTVGVGLILGLPLEVPDLYRFWAIVGLMGLYTLSQGLADFGKGATQVEVSSKPTWTTEPDR